MKALLMIVLLLAMSACEQESPIRSVEMKGGCTIFMKYKTANFNGTYVEVGRDCNEAGKAK